MLGFRRRLEHGAAATGESIGGPLVDPRRGALVALVVMCVAALLVAAPAAAHPDDDEDHPGWYTPSPESSTKNLKLIASAEKTRPLSTYRNSDLAFWGNLAYAGNYEGFRIIDIAQPESPRVLADVICPGAQHDVSVWRNLLFLSIDAARTGPGCDSTAVPSTATGFEGIRIFDVSDPTAPEFVTGVATDCGSHTHTLVPDARNGRVLLYISSYPASNLGQSTFGNSCARRNEDGTEGHSKISVVEVPVAAPESASVVSEVPLEMRPIRNIDGYKGCHDITVFLPTARAGAACSGEGQIWDISNLEQPRTIGRIHNPQVEFWHSAAFTWDGKRVVFGDEAGGGTGPRCREEDPASLGALWSYDVASLRVTDETTVSPWLGTFKVPRQQGNANCTMHNFNFVPIAGRDVLVSSAYAAGTTVVDFTDPARPKEVGHHDPHGANTWSSYWYNGFIYTNDTGRGVDVMLLTDRIRSAAQKLPRLNPQTQESRLR
jgi:hypothetical protein